MKQNNKLKQFLITFFHDDNTSMKYMIHRTHYYDAKNDAESLKHDVNDDTTLDYKITNFDIEELTPKTSR